MAKKAHLYINVASIDRIRIMECGPVVNHVAECKTKVHFKDDLVSVKPTKGNIDGSVITADGTE